MAWAPRVNILHQQSPKQINTFLNLCCRSFGNIQTNMCRKNWSAITKWKAASSLQRPSVMYPINNDQLEGMGYQNVPNLHYTFSFLCFKKPKASFSRKKLIGNCKPIKTQIQIFFWKPIRSPPGIPIENWPTLNMKIISETASLCSQQLAAIFHSVAWVVEWSMIWQIFFPEITCVSFSKFIRSLLKN